MRVRQLVCLGVFAGLSVPIVCLWSSQSHGKDATEDPAIARTRKIVRMLDDIYKGAIVLVTTHYVHDDDDLPAGTAFKEIFKTAKEKGWHEVRLLDATGDPYNEENVAADDFEKSAIKELKGGKPYYEQVVERDGARYLRAATPIPVVMQKCTMCHPNYEGVEKNTPIGALGYTIRIE